MESSTLHPLVLVTGASGYLGSWCVAKLLDTGKYRVRGTVRDHTDAARMEVLREGFGENFEKIEFVSAQLEDEEAIRKAVEGVECVLHVASPLPGGKVKNAEKEVIKPAVEGTKNVLQACVGSTVKRVIITSSSLTAQDFWSGDEKISDHTTVVKERKDMMPYVKSKIRAEKYAFDFMKNLEPSKRTFEMMTIHPGFITGRSLLPRAEGSSLSLFKKILENKMSGVPQMYLSCVDVQDAAQAHVKAIEKGRNGERYPLTCGNHKIIELFLVIREEYQSQGYKIKNKEMSKCLVYIGSFFSYEASFALKVWNLRGEMDGSFAAEELGIKYKPMKESVLETCESLIGLGLVKKPKIKK